MKQAVSQLMDARKRLRVRSSLCTAEFGVLFREHAKFLARLSE